jgi:hypothetical protein
MAHNESLHAAQVKVSCRDRECALEICSMETAVEQNIRTDEAEARS